MIPLKEMSLENRIQAVGSIILEQIDISPQDEEDARQEIALICVEYEAQGFTAALVGPSRFVKAVKERFGTTWMRRKLESDSEEILVDAQESLLDNRIREETEGFERIDREEIKARMIELLHQVYERDGVMRRGGEILKLHFIGGLKQTEIAGIFGVSHQVISYNIHRELRKLRYPAFTPVLYDLYYTDYARIKRRYTCYF